MEDRIQRMKELVSVLREAGKAYYQESREIMSNFEYDKLYDELVSLEKETGVTLSGSPSQQVGYEILRREPWQRRLPGETERLARSLRPTPGCLSISP